MFVGIIAFVLGYLLEYGLLIMVLNLYTYDPYPVTTPLTFMFVTMFIAGIATFEHDQECQSPIGDVMEAINKADCESKNGAWDQKRNICRKK